MVCRKRTTEEIGDFGEVQEEIRRKLAEKLPGSGVWESKARISS
jgi:hypothetical protein